MIYIYIYIYLLAILFRNIISVLTICAFLYPIKNFLGNAQGLRWACLRLLIIVGPWLAFAAFIEGNFPQCGPQYIAVFGGTIPIP